MSLDFSTCYQFFHNGSTVIHTSITESGSTTTSVAGAQKQSVKQQDAAGAWVISARDAVWFLPGALVATEPKEGDTITDGSDVWTVKDAGKEPLTNLWQLNCVREQG